MLIQKDVKQLYSLILCKHRLRALLIQKDVKPFQSVNTYTIGLRALLIQKDVKLTFMMKYM